MKLISSFFEKSKNKPDLWIFYIFLLVLPFTIRKVIFFYPLGLGNQKTFNEYSSIYFYLSDIFILLLIFSWIVSILYNKNIDLSIIYSLSPKKLWITCVNYYKKINFNIIYSKTKHFFIKLFHSFKNVPSQSECFTPARSNLRSKLGGWNIYKDKLIFIPLLLVIWSFISIFWSENHLIAFYRSLRILEFFLLYLYIKERLFNTKLLAPALNNLQNKLGGWNIWKNICHIFIFLGLFQAIIGIWQFFIQKSIGLFWLKESLISPEILGVAKIIIGGEKYIRSYGLFPHPNILGGFLLLTIIFTYGYKKAFSNIKNVPSQSECSTWNIVPRGTSDGTSVEHLKILRDGSFINIFLIIQIIGLLLTFSKSAIIGLFIAIVYIFINTSKTERVPRLSRENEIVPRGTILFAFGMKQFRQLKYLFILSFLLFGVLLFYFKIDLYTLFIQSIQERFIYLTASIQAIVQNMLWGLGDGQFVLEMAKYSFQNLEFWQFQPVHNVFLLIFSELGMIGLFLFVWFILELFHPSQNVPRGTSDGISVEQYDKWNIYLKSILLGFTFIMIFDHYLWDIQQGSLVLWTVMGLIVAKK